MAKNSAISTGVLRFANGVKITPVIRALFSAFALNPDYPPHEPDLAYIARDQDNEVTWGVIRDDLKSECNVRGLEIPPDADPADLTEYVYTLAEHVGFKDPDFKLQNLLENAQFSDWSDADLVILFEIATLLDDGHGLRGVQMEGAYFSDRKDIGEFGGMAEFITQDVCAHGSSSQINDRAFELDDVLNGWTPETADVSARAAAEQIAKVMAEQLNCINDPDKRAAVAAHLPAAAAAQARLFGAPAADEDVNVTEFGVNVMFANSCSEKNFGNHNPFDKNFPTQALAENAAREYLLTPGCEEDLAVVFRLVIEKNQTTEDVELTWFDKAELLKEQGESSTADAPR